MTVQQVRMQTWSIMASNRTKQEHLAALFRITQKHPGKKTTVITKLEDYGITIDEFSEY